MAKHPSVISAIGNTPLIRLNRVSELTGCEIWGKAEFLNPGQSVKDRAALFIVRVADPSWYALGGVEPLIYATAAAIAFAIAALAGIPSARRAAAVQPMDAIRSD